jgi:hypothetical protein
MQYGSTQVRDCDPFCRQQHFKMYTAGTNQPGEMARGLRPLVELLTPWFVAVSIEPRTLSFNNLPRLPCSNPVYPWHRHVPGRYWGTHTRAIAKGIIGGSTPGAKMAPILVVGATGQLGTAAIDRLVGRGHVVRALVRPGSPREFPPNGVELAFGDLRD